MADGVRTTDLNVSSHSRLVYENVIPGLRAAFDQNYNRERQFEGLRITQSYPNKKVDYPAIVVEYQPQRVVAAGIGHIEIFPDPHGHLRKWKHSRFEGTLSLRAYALSTKDRDILADAIVELIRFGSLDSQLNQFYEMIYPSETALENQAIIEGGDYAMRLFSQLMLDSDQLYGVGNSAEIAPWQPEDLLVYSGGWTMNIHGGYYNTYPTVDWSRVTRIVIDAYAQDRVGHDLPFPEHAEISWAPPFLFEDAAVVGGRGRIAMETADQSTVHGQGVVRSDETFIDV